MGIDKNVTHFGRNSRKKPRPFDEKFTRKVEKDEQTLTLSRKIRDSLYDLKGYTNRELDIMTSNKISDHLNLLDPLKSHDEVQRKLAEVVQYVWEEHNDYAERIQTMVHKIYYAMESRKMTKREYTYFKRATIKNISKKLISLDKLT